MADPIHYRPHHFLCPLGFEGKGYSPGYTANMSEIVIGRLRGAGGDKVLIEVKAGLDDICAPCSKKRGSACAVQEKIAGLDRAHAAALRIAPGDRLTWGEAQARIRKEVPSGSLKSLCKGCEWQPLGMCEAALARLHGRPAI